MNTVLMGALDDIYADLDVEISKEEFRTAVEEKVEQMGGLADEETAAMLIAHELADRDVETIADIEAGMEEVSFLGKVLRIGDRREFDRDDQETDGRVTNIELGDETGRIRAAFWDDMADAASEDLETGQVLKIQGRPTEGINGVEVSVSRVEPAPEIDLDVDTGDEYTIDDLSMGLSDVTVRGRVLDVDSDIRTFERDDGTEGRVANLVLSDETGRIRVTCWDEQTELLEAIVPGDSVELIDGYVREQDDELELHVGRRGTIEQIDEEIEFASTATAIANVELDTVVDLTGVVRSADPKRTFDRDDGSEGQVRNIRLQDQTGDIRVALWGEKADLDVAPGDEILLTDVEIQDGWQDDLEGSANWRSTVTVLEDNSVDIEAEATGESAAESDSADLGAFSQESDPDPDQESSEAVEFTGVVVQAGQPVVLDNGEETVTLDRDIDVELGQELTVRGDRSEGELSVEELV